MTIKPESLWVNASRLKGAGVVLRAARHNLREISSEKGGYGSISPAHSHMNKILRGAGKASAVDAEATALMSDAGITKLRRDAVLAVEVVVSLKNGSGVDAAAYFAESTAWAETYFAVPLILAVVHYDQGNPHLHLLFVPLVGERMRGSALIGSQYKLRFMVENFFEVVGKKHGLTCPDLSGKKAKATVGFGEEVGAKATVGFACAKCSKPYLCSVPRTQPLTQSQRIELLTAQFTVGIQRKLARGSHRWAH
jgi:hypothetical protein